MASLELTVERDVVLNTICLYTAAWFPGKDFAQVRFPPPHTFPSCAALSYPVATTRVSKKGAELDLLDAYRPHQIMEGWERAMIRLMGISEETITAPRVSLSLGVEARCSMMNGLGHS